MMNIKPFPKRWWYARPCIDTMRRLPLVKFYQCGDEYCNDTLYMRAPLLGELTVRVSKTIRLYGRCEQCVAEYGPWCEGCNDCHYGPRCHYWIKCTNEELSHESKIERCPACNGNYCPECEQHPEENCPEGNERGKSWQKH